MLRRLNAAGYGVEGSGLELALVSSPVGAFLPVPQAQAEKKFRFLYDCDFNLAAGRHQGERRAHVSEVRRLPPPGTPIAAGNHCYACTVGSGFT